MQKTTKITVAYDCELHVFNVVPLTTTEEFLENVAMLVKPTDVALGVEMGWWYVVA